MRHVDTEQREAVRPRIADPAYAERLRQARERRKMIDPTRDHKLPHVFVGYVWSPTYSEWILCGFIRTKHLKLKSVAKYRRRFTIPNGAIFKLQELFVAAACGPGDPPTPRVLDWRPGA